MDEDGHSIGWSIHSLSWIKSNSTLKIHYLINIIQKAYGTGEAEAGTDISVTKSTTIVSGITISMIYILMSPLAVLMVIYATLVYSVRRKCLKSKQVPNFIFFKLRKNR